VGLGMGQSEPKGGIEVHRTSIVVDVTKYPNGKKKKRVPTGDD